MFKSLVTISISVGALVSFGVIAYKLYKFDDGNNSDSSNNSENRNNINSDEEEKKELINSLSEESVEKYQLQQPMDSTEVEAQQPPEPTHFEQEKLSEPVDLQVESSFPEQPLVEQPLKKVQEPLEPHVESLIPQQPLHSTLSEPQSALEPTPAESEEELFVQEQSPKENEAGLSIKPVDIVSNITMNQSFREDLLQFLKSKIRDRELALENQKNHLLEEIETTMVELDAQPSLFEADGNINEQYTQLIGRLNRTKSISSHMVSIESFYSIITNIYNENQIKLNQSYGELRQLYSDLGIGLDIKFKEIGLPSNRRISEIQVEVKRLRDIQCALLGQINELKLSIIKSANEMELTKQQSDNFNWLFNIYSQGIGIDSGIGELDKLCLIHSKLDSFNKELNQLKLWRSENIANISNSIDNYYIELGIDKGDENRVRFNQERDYITIAHSSISPALVNCLYVESERLKELKKLKL